MVTPLDYAQGDEHIPQRRYPFKVEPRASESFTIMTGAMLRQNIKAMRQRQPRWRRPLFRFTWAIVRSDDGRTFRVELSKLVRREIKDSPTRMHP